MSSRIIGPYHQSFSRCGNVNNAFRVPSTVLVAFMPSRPVRFPADSRADQVEVGPTILLSVDEMSVGPASCCRFQVPVRRTNSNMPRCIVNRTGQARLFRRLLLLDTIAAKRNSFGSPERAGAPNRWMEVFK